MELRRRWRSSQEGPLVQSKNHVGAGSAHGNTTDRAGRESGFQSAGLLCLFALLMAAVTMGCQPNERYCPDGYVEKTDPVTGDITTCLRFEEGRRIDGGPVGQLTWASNLHGAPVLNEGATDRPFAELGTVPSETVFYFGLRLADLPEGVGGFIREGGVWLDALFRQPNGVMQPPLADEDVPRVELSETDLPVENPRLDPEDPDFGATIAERAARMFSAAAQLEARQDGVQLGGRTFQFFGTPGAARMYRVLVTHPGQAPEQQGIWRRLGYMDDPALSNQTLVVEYNPNEQVLRLTARTGRSDLPAVVDVENASVARISYDGIYQGPGFDLHLVYVTAQPGEAEGEERAGGSTGHVIVLLANGFDPMANGGSGSFNYERATTVDLPPNWQPFTPSARMTLGDLEVAEESGPVVAAAGHRFTAAITVTSVDPIDPSEAPLPEGMDPR